MSKKSDVIKSKENIIDNQTLENLYGNASNYIDHARQTIQKSVDIEVIKAYWYIGRDIVIEQQKGEARAAYGKTLLKSLSQKLQARYKKGFSVDTLEKSRKFYQLYQEDRKPQKSATMSRKSEEPELLPNLSWSHYVELLSVKREEARKFYALEASQNRWTIRELRRQIDSFLYDRLSKTKNKEQILDLARKGQEIIKAEDVIKEPMILEFLGITAPHNLSETKLETALINNLQSFLLELGKGFAFIGRQKRLSFDNQHFYADLVFYHAILKCYLIIDLKTHELKHSDLGQMQLYVNYFDMEIKQESDNPTIGLVLCTKKHEKMAKYMLGEKAKQIFANTYQFHLPTEEELEKELKREISEIKYALKDKSND